MTTIGNMPYSDIKVKFPSGETRTVNIIVMLAETLNAEFKCDYNLLLPGVGKQNPTIQKLVDKYELEYFFDGPVRNWRDCAAVMRHMYGVFDEYIKSQRYQL